MTFQRDHVYRNGRLLLPRDLADRDPRAQAHWLSGVPLSDRARAFRALPLNVGAAAFLSMEPRGRVGLLAGLNRQNIRYLSSIASDEFLLETLEYAGEDVHGAVLAELPDWRHQRITTALEQRRLDRAAEQARRRNAAVSASMLGRFAVWRLMGWLTRAVRQS